jgi:hypothetical protein
MDAQQLPVPGASVGVANAQGVTAATAISAEDGSVRFDLPAGGPYTVLVELSGFRPFVKAGLRVVAGQQMTLAASLVEAPVTEQVTVTATTPPETSVEAGATQPAGTVQQSDIKRLRVNAVRDTLPLVPNVIRSSTGELSFKGSTEEHGGLLINGMNASDPATGTFHFDLPVDSVDSVKVFLHPYAAEYGQFTSGLTTVETRRAGDRWRFEVNDFLPDFRFVRGRIHGIAEDSPHLILGGPMFDKRVYVTQSAAFTLANSPVRGLLFPDNETHTVNESSYTQFDIVSKPHHIQRVTLNYFNQNSDYVGLDVFRPRPVTPSTAQRDLGVTARDNSEVAGGLLSMSASVSAYRKGVSGLGDTELTITPTVELGNYFASQNRRSTRTELNTVYSFPVWNWNGRHEIRIGGDFSTVGSDSTYSAHPVNVVREDGTLAERIEFDPAGPIAAHNREFFGFIQDHWQLGAQVTLDAGLRYEDQQIADGLLVAPRVGVAWAPFGSSTTVIRGGIGLFYDKVPLNVRSFASYPSRIVSLFANDGVTLLDQHRYVNVLVDAATPAYVPFSRRTNDPAAFVPQNLSGNVEIDHVVTQWLTLRANAILSNTTNVYIVTPQITPTGDAAYVLSSTGRSNYRALEFTGRIGRASRAVNVSYTRSIAMGDLNEFNVLFGDVASPLIRPNQYSREPTDVPNRVVAWGEVALPLKFNVAPVLEIRSGFPYSIVNAAQDFVGIRNDTADRFPRFIALDMVVSKDVQVRKSHSVRLSIRAFNVTNHFNPRDVHANIDDPLYGQFLASYRRYFAGGFDILF